ncbi:class I SAM-dependent methyltransferase [Mucilaginibacter sp. AW1-7]|jgi:precorrin-6B methylase 2|uniref:class I SAM-dependent methyltransferase n=1 Tax=unclassified Mucilaginibacter TaxID=2617802 RepID=UPI00236584BA|nr:class I SAM-dependent methyltransferase [Mucilaginibacter sp. KACC 22773]WDF77838.1 class I SAM-dependent methyltransferase [Mucilaginibacter sp. KACC 22773]
MSVAQLKKLDTNVAAVATIDGRSLKLFFKYFKELVNGLEISNHREDIINLIPNIRSVAATSPFVNKAQQWPRGYQGDFETIGHLISGENKAVPGTTGHLLEDFFLTSDICKQHIQKVQYQSALIKKVVTGNPLASIMSIGCGTSEDIRLNIDLIKGTQIDITIVDADRDALACSMQNLEAIKYNVSAVHGNIYKIARTLNQQYDLIIIGGVFDYLSDKAITRVLSALKQNLAAGGKIFFTNIKHHNPYRIYMEYLSDWILIERTEQDIYRLLADSGLENYAVKLQVDETGLTYLVEVTNKAF